MDAKKVAMDLKVWLLIAVIAGLLIEPLKLDVSVLLIVLLMIQMTLSMDGMIYKRESLLKKSNLINAVMTCYVINTVITLLVGSVFLWNNEDVWYGFAMIAAMPCAVAVITGTVLKRNDINDGVAAVTYTYLIALFLSPIISYLTIGNAVNPFEILKYIILFIVVPIVVTRFTTKLGISREVKVPLINLCMALIMFLCINRARTAIVNDPAITGMIVLVLVVRILVLHIATYLYIRNTNVPKENETTFHTMGVWKNTGLSVSMCILLIPTPISAVPGVITIMIENIWFSIVTSDWYSVKRKKNPM